MNFFLISSMVGSLDIRSFGAVPNLSSSDIAINNMIALQLAINEASLRKIKVKINGTYYIQKPTTTIGLIETHVDIIGENTAELIFINRGGVLFSLPSEMTKLNISNVSIKNQTGGNLLFINTIDTGIDNFIIQNCIFEGPLTIRITQSSDAIETKGFDTAIIQNNIFNGINMTFFVFTNSIYNELIVRNNQIYNMLFSFMIIDIGNPTLSNQIHNEQVLLLAEDNLILNDEETILTESIGSYYVFLQVLGRECIYRRNHMEGVKSKVIAAIYDVYMSTAYGTYENNTFKNNLCFAAVVDTGTKACFKAKGGTILKVCQNNSFIIEEEFVRNIVDSDPLLDIENAWISSISISSDAENDQSTLIVRNNTFDVFHLRHYAVGGGGSVYLLKQLTFENNVWNVNKVDGDAFIWLRQPDPLGVNRYLTFEGNNINKIGEETFELETFIQGSGLYTPGVSDLKYVSFKNNNIEGSIDNMFNFITLHEVVFENNTIPEETVIYGPFAIIN